MKVSIMVIVRPYMKVFTNNIREVATEKKDLISAKYVDRDPEILHIDIVIQDKKEFNFAVKDPGGGGCGYTWDADACGCVGGGTWVATTAASGCTCGDAGTCR
jgi:hypothetical protein